MPYMEMIEAAVRCTNGGTGAVSLQRGCTLARAAAGQYDMTLERALNVAEGVILVEQTTTDLLPFVTHTTDLAKRITFRTNAPADADSTFAACAIRLAYGGQ
jgi:hypothetical protein